MTDLSQYEVTIDNLKMLMERGWEDLQAYINTLTEEQLTQPTDAAGWTVKDHLIHLAVWEDGMIALLDHKPRYERMGVPKEVWNSDDVDVINDVIYQKHKDTPLAEVQATFQQVHDRLMAKIRTLTTEDILRPDKYYNPESNSDDPVVGRIAGNTFGHYEEHKPWMEAIAQHG